MKIVVDIKFSSDQIFRNLNEEALEYPRAYKGPSLRRIKRCSGELLKKVKMNKIIMLLVSVAAIGCVNGSKGGQNSLGNPVYYAKSDVYGSKSKRKLGTLKFSEAFGKVKVVGKINGLITGGEHGVSIYEFGDCSNTGARYRGMDKNPTKEIGRLGNIIADKKGSANIEMEIEGLSVNTGKYPIVGRSIVIHQHKDDMVSKGHGGAGLKIACGVIGAASK